MPELPEVETTIRALRQPLVGRTIVGVQNYWPRHLVTPPLAELAERIQGRRIEAIDRRGKYLVFSLSEGETLIVHLKMTGHLSIVAGGARRDPHSHTIFSLAEGADREPVEELHFNDPRKFGRVYLVRDPQEVLGTLGPEPLEPSFTVEMLAARLHGRRRVLKSLLLDQTFMAGVGNIYADEALHAARLHPERRADTLTNSEVRALHKAIRRVLEIGIEREGASIDRYRKPDGQKGEMQNAVAVFRRTGGICYRCGDVIQRTIVGGRSTHFCAGCQK